MKGLENYSFTCLERFLRYVRIHTQSDPHSLSNPSTARQKDLGKVLVEELQQMGIDDAGLDEFGYVYATVPATTVKEVPVICFCSHMDTSPDCSGADVKPIVHTNYQGQDLVLPDDPAEVIRKSEHPDLAAQIGNDIITASGTTLLGADNKAGIAEIMDAANFLMSHPEIKHGKIRILFTPDEEIGRGVEKVDLVKLGAQYAYTVDGETAGSIENETFSADSAILKIQGVSAHPGFAKGKMQSAIKIASEIVANLPKDRMSPESTTAKEGFIHPVGITGSVEEATIEFILRDFDEEELINQKRLLLAIADEVLEGYPNSQYRLEIKEQYRNMKSVLDKHPNIIRVAQLAIERAGLAPKLQSIRGGTDGSRLSFMGLPCPNIFAGEHAFHGKQEWVSVQDMQKAVQTIVNLAIIWEEQS
ncbi:peptidase T [Paradesertivirga mongoliensis]|uniref:Peptidase T n=1 Tax=Paradesertivirga mongoliensis TaxID=2100740 RepID=A0ABW4ZIA6_9SPHI|nr:peptidase T [Pedobacter mongoliensis]